MPKASASRGAMRPAGIGHVDVHVRQLRRKLGDASPIVTVWGVGYKVASERTAAPTA